MIEGLDVGLRQILGGRSQQEDSAAVWSQDGLFRETPGVNFDAANELVAEAVAVSERERLFAVLADGMGGHAAGDVASQLICRTFLADLIVTDQPGDVRNRLRSSLAVANTAVLRAIDEEHGRHGMGATLVGLEFARQSTATVQISGSAASQVEEISRSHIRPWSVDWVSVGDSPLYLVRDKELALLNEDHSLAPALDRLVQEGRLTEAEARADPRRHMLRSAITGDPIDLVDLSTQSLELVSGDIIIAASDGVQTLEDDEIARIATGYIEQGADEIAAALVRAVELVRDPVQDNATVLVFLAQ